MTDMARTQTVPGGRSVVARVALLVGVNALVGAMLGQERAVLPLLAREQFGLDGGAAALSFIVVFGLSKAATNTVAGHWADRVGRKPVLLAGWLAGAGVAPLLIWAPSWGWVLAANVLLGVNQGLAWSATVVMKLDLVPPRRRGLVMGLNEGAGYAALSLTALGTGFIAEQWGLRPAPFLIGVVVAALGLGTSALLVEETRATVGTGRSERPRFARVAATVTWRDRRLAAATRAGLVNNLNDGAVWGLLPLLLRDAGLTLSEVGAVVAVYPAVWGLAQFATGPWSDRAGRRRLVVGGMLLQAAALVGIAAVGSFRDWLAAAAALGLGTAMVYPTLLAVVGDTAPASWRASALGVYRGWRDAGFAAGALLAGVVADRWGPRPALLLVALLTAAAGLHARRHLPPRTVSDSLTYSTSI